MSSPHDPLGSEHRRLRGESDRRERAIDAIVYYGLGQVLLLSPLMLWHVFQSPFRRGDVVIGAIAALTCLPVAIGVRRRGTLGGEREWPRIDDVTLGVGGGFRTYLGRGVFLSAVVGIAAYGAAIVGLFTAGLLPRLAVAVGSVVCCVAWYPAICGTDLRERRARFGLYALALAGGFYFGAPFFPGAGFHSAYLVYPLLVALGVLDLLW